MAANKLLDCRTCGVLPVSKLNGRSCRPVFVQSLVVVSRCGLLDSPPVVEVYADCLAIQIRHGWDCLLDFRRKLLGGLIVSTRAHWILINVELLQFFQRFAEVRDDGLVTDLVVV